MEWGEALRQAELLLKDPTSWLTVSVQKWDHPISREALVAMDHFDLVHALNSKRPPKPHSGRPWKAAGSQKIHGKARPMREAVEILNRFGHQIPV